MAVGQRPGPTVVLVDDDRDTLEVLAIGLARCGAVVSSYADAEEAVAALRRLEPDALITDLELFPRDGYWLIEQVRAIPRLARLPVVVLTGHGDTEHVEAARRAGADDILIKPVESRAIYAHILRLIRD